MWLFFAFVGIPLIEITLFVQVGGLIGLWPTLLIVIGTAALGTWLVRSQGIRAVMDIRNSIERAGDPTEPLAHGAMILFSGVLLLTPGFFTDAVGFALLVPQVRDAAIRYVRNHAKVQTYSSASASFRTGGARPGAGRGPVIDGEFQEIDPDSVPPKPGEKPSRWTQP